VSPWQVVAGIVAGFVAGVLAGAFGVGGGIVTTPAVEVILGGTPLQAVATPLPVIFPTAIAGALRYRKAGEVSARAAKWAAVPGAIGAAAAAEVVGRHLIDTRWLLLATAILLLWQSVSIASRRQVREHARGETPGWQYGMVGLAAGTVSGLLGVGGGIVFVPLLVGALGMPLKRALGTSLLVIPAFVVPATIVYALNGAIDWTYFLILVIGVVPGARLGARLSLSASERNLRVAVGIFLGLVAISYGALQVARMAGGG
jgi:uncharacterized membrane protein YfcA